MKKLKIKLSCLISRLLLRSVYLALGLCILSHMLQLPRAVSAPSQVELNAGTIPPTVEWVIFMTLPNPIFRRWIHSREEDEGDILVYRPIDYPFPPARGREGLEFRENGEFIRYQIGATDRSVGLLGEWKLQPRNFVAVQFLNQSASSYTLTILECNDQILKVRQTLRNTTE